MIPISNKPIAQLPVVPSRVLFQHRVYNEFDTRFRSCARLLQALWRKRQGLPIGTYESSGIAVARLDAIDEDPLPRQTKHYYARVSQFQMLSRPVQYRDANGVFVERVLRELSNPASAGRALHGSSIRNLDDEDFAHIVNHGLVEIFDPANAIRLQLDNDQLDPATLELLHAPPAERRIEQVLLNRKIRDAGFRDLVLDAYDCTCAVTGLRIVNGGGRVEAQAAHIWSVASGGPDEVQNGIALSATAHWLFDRHLISLDEDFGLLVSHNKVPSDLLKLFPPNGRPIRLPGDRRLHPKPEYVGRHRERFAGHAA